MPASRTTIEAIVVTYNSVDDVETCVASMYDAAPTEGDIDFSVAILENASTRSSVDLVHTTFPQVRLIDSPTNLGFGGGMNELIRTSTADYVLIMNPDTVTSEDICTPLLDALESTPGAIVAGPRLVYPDGRLQQSVTRFPSLSFEAGLLLQNTRLGSILKPVWDPRQAVQRVRYDISALSEPTQVESLWATVWLVKRVDALAYGPFSAKFPMYDEDLDFCIRAHRDGRSAVYVPSIEVVHIGGASSTSEQKVAMMRRARRTLHREHSRRPAALAYQGLDKVLSSARRLKARQATA